MAIKYQFTRGATMRREEMEAWFTIIVTKANLKIGERERDWMMSVTAPIKVSPSALLFSIDLLNFHSK